MHKIIMCLAHLLYKMMFVSNVWSFCAQENILYPTKGLLYSTFVHRHTT